MNRDAEIAYLKQRIRELERQTGKDRRHPAAIRGYRLPFEYGVGCYEPDDDNDDFSRGCGGRNRKSSGC